MRHEAHAIPSTPFTTQRRKSMKTFDNSGRLVAEINHFRTADGKSVTTNTMYDTNGGRTVNQNISVFETNGKVTTTNVINGKLLP
jgi:hypothetical protein